MGRCWDRVGARKCVGGSKERYRKRCGGDEGGSVLGWKGR